MSFTETYRDDSAKIIPGFETCRGFKVEGDKSGTLAQQVFFGTALQPADVILNMRAELLNRLAHAEIML